MMEREDEGKGVEGYFINLVNTRMGESRSEKRDVLTL